MYTIKSKKGCIQTYILSWDSAENIPHTEYMSNSRNYTYSVNMAFHL